MKKRTITLLPILLALMALSGFAQAGARDSYDRALELYRAGEFAEAVPLLQQFISAAPQDTKADDAQWYLGRALQKLGRLDEAVQAFEAVRGHEGGSNRAVEATTDLAKIRLDRGEPDAALALLEPLKKTRDLAPEDRRALRLLAEVRLELGTRDWKAYRDQEARYHLGEAVGEYELLLREPKDAKDRLGLLEDLGKTYIKLIETGRNAQAAHVYQEAAIGAFGQALDLDPEEPKKGKLLNLLQSARQPERVALTGTVEAFGGAANAASDLPTASSVWIPGLRASADLLLHLPFGWQNELRLAAGAAADSFSGKASNFPAGETGAERILQSTTDLNAGAAWVAGSKHGLRSELNLSGSYKLAQDPGDDSWNIGLAEQLAWRLSPAWKLGLDGAFLLEKFPEYLTAAGRELDRWELGANPHLTWYPLPDLSLALGYDFTFRQYLNAVYPPDTADKQYLIHRADLKLQATPGQLLHASLDYSLTFNQTRNYTVKVFGNPFDQTVSGYYDYLEHSIGLGARLKWTPDFETTVNAGFAFQNFLNYPARDAAQTFTGEKRKDTHYSLDAEAKYRIWKKKSSRFGDVWADARAQFDQNVSNAQYENSISTNYRTLAVTGGLVLELK